MNLRYDISMIVGYIVMFILFTFWIGGAFGAAVQYGSSLVMVGILAMLRKKIYLSKKQSTILGVLLLAHFIAALTGSVYSSLDLGNVAALLISVIFVGAVGFDEFVCKFTKMMYFLSVYSLITYMLYQIIPGFFWILPKVKGTVWVANCFFSLVPIGMDGYYRNFGCWGEPGMFAVYLSFAIMFELFYIERSNVKHIVILCLAMVTTFSTGGYISLILLALGYFFYNKTADVNRRSRKILISGGLVGLFILMILFSTGYFGNRSYVFRKLAEFTSTSGTTFERMRAVSLALKAIKQYFPFGCGWGNYASIYLQGNILTTTPLNWFAVYGVLYGMIMNIGLFMIGYGSASKWWTRILTWGGILAVAVSQDMTNMPMAIMVILYMYGIPHKVGEDRRERI